MNLPNMPKLKDIKNFTGEDKQKYVFSFLMEYTSPFYALLKYSDMSLKQNFEILHEQKYDERLKISHVKLFVDEFIKASPAWPATLYRGVNLDYDELTCYLENPNEVSMNGISSWSTQLDIAEKYSQGTESTSVVYVLNKNLSATNISHLSLFYFEREVIAPSDVKYTITNKELKENILYIYLEELEA